MNELEKELADANWRKSSFSGGNGGNCVEVAFLSGGRVGVRHSKHADGPALVYTPGEWDAFIKGVKADEF